MTDHENTPSPLHWAAGYKPKKPVSEQNIRPLAEMERTYIEMVIEMCRGNIPKAAELLKISPSTIYRKQSRWYE